MEKTDLMEAVPREGLAALLFLLLVLVSIWVGIASAFEPSKPHRARRTEALRDRGKISAPHRHSSSFFRTIAIAPSR